MTTVPVHDGRHRHRREVAHRRLYRPRREPQLRRGTTQSAKARAVEARMRQSADARERYAPAVVATDHRDARGATVHLVDLRHVRERANTLAALDEAAVRLERMRWRRRRFTVGRG